MDVMDAMPGEHCGRCDRQAIGAAMIPRPGQKASSAGERLAVCRLHYQEVEAEQKAERERR
jgi:hypothetical protein